MHLNISWKDKMTDQELWSKAGYKQILRAGNRNGSGTRVYYQLRQLRPVVRSITEDAAKMVVQAFVSSRLDYCNSLLCGIAVTCCRNSSRCRMITRTGRREHIHITPVLRELHWSPVRLQASCSCAQGVTWPASTVPDWRLSALDRHRPPITAISWCLDVSHKRTRTRLGNRSFFVAGPCLWNCRITWQRYLTCTV